MDQTYFEDEEKAIDRSRDTRWRKRRTYRWIVIFVVVVIVNTIIAQTFDGYFPFLASPYGNLSIFLLGNLMWSAALSLFFSLLPYKKLNYKQKYIPMVFIIGIVFNGLFLLTMTIRMIRFWMV